MNVSFSISHSDPPGRNDKLNEGGFGSELTYWMCSESNSNNDSNILNHNWKSFCRKQLEKNEKYDNKTREQKIRESKGTPRCNKVIIKKK